MSQVSVVVTVGAVTLWSVFWLVWAVYKNRNEDVVEPTGEA